jgi:hypothetical protein
VLAFGGAAVAARAVTRQSGSVKVTTSPTQDKLVKP